MKHIERWKWCVEIEFFNLNGGFLHSFQNNYKSHNNTNRISWIELPNLFRANRRMRNVVWTKLRSICLVCKKNYSAECVSLAVSIFFNHLLNRQWLWYMCETVSFQIKKQKTQTTLNVCTFCLRMCVCSLFIHVKFYSCFVL